MQTFEEKPIVPTNKPDPAEVSRLHKEGFLKSIKGVVKLTKKGKKLLKKKRRIYGLVGCCANPKCGKRFAHPATTIQYYCSPECRLIGRGSKRGKRIVAAKKGKERT